MAKKNIVDQYIVADDEARVDIILDNYPGFKRKLDGYVSSLSARIQRERASNRRRELGDLGVRVQTSGVSNPTKNEACTHAEIEEAINNGDWMTALKGSDDVLGRRAIVETIGEMRYHYTVVCGMVDGLDDNDYVVFTKYLDTHMTYDELADFFKSTHESVKSRIYRSRASVKQWAIPLMKSELSNCA
ncbi:hypothetical protein [Butyrivibrio sp.]|uniref:hypothetical protein n=1 Tax=Butyrivibrio sp. TaxID=28121 RepID=UPI0025BF5F46|nr:hypothetical protein [Butyrivibrio sp.]MBE5837938.1 hypothetical protein [Butyrivibrio sp.]